MEVRKTDWSRESKECEFYVWIHHADNPPNMLHPNPYNEPLLQYEEPSYLASSLADFVFPQPMRGARIDSKVDWDLHRRSLRQKDRYIS